MALTKKDFDKLGTLVDEKLSTRMDVMETRIFGEMNKRDEKLMGKMDGLEKKMFGEMNKRDEKLMGKISGLMDERMLYFHEQVTEPMINNIVEMLRDDISKVEDNTYRIEKKLDNISDHHSEKIDDHEKRIVRLERGAFASL